MLRPVKMLLLPVSKSVAVMNFVCEIRLCILNTPDSIAAYGLKRAR